jgi:hypothetical protein
MQKATGDGAIVWAIPGTRLTRMPLTFRFTNVLGELA